MKKELEEELYAIYPEAFKGREDMRTSCMYWGFDFGDGWYPLAKALVELARWNFENPKMVPDEKGEYREPLPCVPDTEEAWKEFPDRVTKEIVYSKFYGTGSATIYQHKCEQPWFHWRMVQAKQKFGTLRWYTSFEDSEYRGAVRLAEHLSAMICEECGRPGTVSGKGWLKTRCEGHK